MPERNDFLDKIRDIACDAKWEVYHDNPQVARTLLSRLYNVLLLAGEDLVVNYFEALLENGEEGLDAKVQRFVTSFQDPENFRWGVSGSVEEVFEEAVLVLRYLDSYLYDWIQDVREDCISEFVTDDGFYVVPCKKWVDPESDLVGKGFKRRGLLHHRIFPKSVNGRNIELHFHDDLDFEPPEHLVERRIAAALFPRFELECVFQNEDNQNFLVAGIKSDFCQGELVKQHCSQAASENCDTLVWPELTMPSESIEIVKKALQVSSLSGQRAPITVAGSWHVKDKDGYRNRSTVLDGRGEVLFSVDKCLRFMFRKEGSSEDVKPGDTVHLLFTGSELIAFFICLDFCHNERRELIEACDASLVIVPSMGEGATMVAHIRRATELSISRGAQTLVVQQALIDAKNTGEKTVGYVLPASGSPSKLVHEGLLTSNLFTSFYAGEEDWLNE